MKHNSRLNESTTSVIVKLLNLDGLFQANKQTPIFVNIVDIHCEVQGINIHNHIVSFPIFFTFYTLQNRIESNPINSQES